MELNANGRTRIPRLSSVSCHFLVVFLLAGCGRSGGLRTPGSGSAAPGGAGGLRESTARVDAAGDSPPASGGSDATGGSGGMAVGGTGSPSSAGTQSGGGGAVMGAAGAWSSTGPQGGSGGVMLGGFGPQSSASSQAGGVGGRASTLAGGATTNISTSSSSGRFRATGKMTVARGQFTATRLTDGKILVAGGTVGGRSLITAELYDPATEQFTSVGDMTMERQNHAAVLLSNGRVLLTGGRLPPMSVEDPDTLLASAELYDPATKTFTATGDMTAARGKPLAVLLKNDKVLVVGGQVGNRDRSGAELYDPISGRFSAVDGLARLHGAATNLDDGKVLLSGNSGPAEIYDAQTGSFSDAGSMSADRTDFSATLLVNGGVLIAGGRGDPGSGSPRLSAAEIFMPTSGAFIPVEPMNVARSQHTATRLADNKVLVCGGSGDDRAEIYDPTAGGFALAGKMVALRQGHTAIALANGKVLILGGQGPTAPNAELYEP